MTRKSEQQSVQAILRCKTKDERIACVCDFCSNISPTNADAHAVINGLINHCKDSRRTLFYVFNKSLGYVYAATAFMAMLAYYANNMPTCGIFTLLAIVNLLLGGEVSAYARSVYFRDVLALIEFTRYLHENPSEGNSFLLMSLSSFTPPVNRQAYEDALYMALKVHLSPQCMAQAWLEQDPIGVNRLMHAAIKRQDSEGIIHLLNWLSRNEAAGRHAVRYWRTRCFTKGILRANTDLKEAFRNCLASINGDAHNSEHCLLRVPTAEGNLLRAVDKDAERVPNADIQFCSNNTTDP